MGKGYAGKILFVDLTSGKLNEEALSDEIYRSFLGCAGLGVRILYERMKPNAAPLGPDNIIGFAPGLLTATGAPVSSRYEVFCKSPLTHAWGQANSGGYFGSELKAAGYDAVFFSGVSPRPVYLLISDSEVALKDAAHLWGKDTVETEESLHAELGDKTFRVACIGPSGESLSLISCVINDRGRAAARCGAGAVMGAKRLKAVAVRGRRKMRVANPEQVKILNGDFIQAIRDAEDWFTTTLKKYGTSGMFLELIAKSDAVVKNWSRTGIEAFPNAEKLDKDNVTKYRVRKFACRGCPIACGSIVKIKAGPYSVSETHRPEYETLAAFGSSCMNDNVESVVKANDICNRYGLDTISTGATIAFAIECYESGIITKRETDGIELTWGNAPAIVAMTEKLARREGFGDILADGVKKAAERIGRGAERFAVHIGGQEPGLRDPRTSPGRGLGYIADASPGRHTSSTLQVAFRRGGSLGSFLGNYPELKAAQKELEEAAVLAVGNKYQAMVSSAGLCSFGIWLGNYPLIELIAAVTGWDFSLKEGLEAGHRIQTLRQAFTARQGISFRDFRLPERMSQAHVEGPLAGKVIDFEAVKASFYAAMGWQPTGINAGRPLPQTLRELGLNELVTRHGI